MKRKAIILASLVALAGGTALAGTGGVRAGLPQGYTLTATSVGIHGTFNGNTDSSLCVACHSVNPLGNGTHFVANEWVAGTSAGVGTVPTALASTYLGTTHGGGGFPGGFITSPATNLRNASAWSTGLASKWTASNDIICESCHSIRSGSVTPFNLLGASVTGTTATICEDCHGAKDSRSNLLDFDTTTATRKPHHVMYNDTMNGTDPNWAKTISTLLSATWCTTKYASGVTPTDVNGTAIDFRGTCNVSGAGTLDNPDADLPLATTTVNCYTCHKVHGAESTAGAFILRNATGAYNGNAAINTLASITAPNNAAAGIRRQFDVGNYDGAKVYGEYLPICVGCHQGYN